MPYWRLFYHLIWATKGRAPVLLPHVDAQLYPYLAQKAAAAGAIVYAVNGWLDHIHMVVAIPPSIAVADIVQRVKGSSSHYLNYVVKLAQPFAWQRGYGALTVGERHLPIVETYVACQKQHHAQQTIHPRLERAEDPDEGPSSPGTIDVDGVHESGVPYNPQEIAEL